MTERQAWPIDEFGPPDEALSWVVQQVDMKVTTVPATPADMGRFLRRLGDDIERAGGDLVLISVVTYPADDDEGAWNVQVVVEQESR